MARFSANLGFLWTEVSLPDAIRAAAHAGFEAVECHFPYDEDPGAVRAALAETSLPMLGLNTARGGQPGDFGLAALPGREPEARAAIEQAVAYAAQIGARAVHVMAGKTDAPGARDTFLTNLDYACRLAAPHGLTVLIEPINSKVDALGYFLDGSTQAQAIISDVDALNLRIMFDCYHLGIMEGNIVETFRRLQPFIGHVQIAGVPGRAEPDTGTLDYRAVIAAIDASGYDGFIGAEYRPKEGTEAGLGWMQAYGAG